MADITQEDVDKALTEYKGKGGEVRGLEDQKFVRFSYKTKIKMEHGFEKSGIYHTTVRSLSPTPKITSSTAKRESWFLYNKRLKKKAELEAAEQHYQDSNAKRKADHE